MPRAVEWRLYNLHHSAMKSRKRSIRIAGGRRLSPFHTRRYRWRSPLRRSKGNARAPRRAEKSCFWSSYADSSFFFRFLVDSNQEAGSSAQASPFDGDAEAEVDPSRSTPPVTTPSAMYDPVRDAADAN